MSFSPTKTAMKQIKMLNLSIVLKNLAGPKCKHIYIHKHYVRAKQPNQNLVILLATQTRASEGLESFHP